MIAHYFQLPSGFTGGYRDGMPIRSAKRSSANSSEKAAARSSALAAKYLNRSNGREEVCVRERNTRGNQKNHRGESDERRYTSG